MKESASGRGGRYRLFLASLSILVLLVALGLGSRSPTVYREASQEPGEFAPVSSPLDLYPGFGNSISSALRDDVIAFSEAFQREQIVQTCMSEANFPYQIDVPYPQETVLHIAEALGFEEAELEEPVDGDEIYGPRASEWNKQYASSLSPADADRYFRTLTGEGVEEVLEYDRTGLAPAGADPATFAEGGCIGRGLAGVPSVWSLRRQLAPEFENVRTSAAEVASQAYEECLAQFGTIGDSPDDVEALVGEAAPTPSDTGMHSERLNACDGTWRSANRQARFVAEAQLLEARYELFASHAEAYGGAKASFEVADYLNLTAACTPPIVGAVLIGGGCPPIVYVIAETVRQMIN